MCWINNGLKKVLVRRQMKAAGMIEKLFSLQTDEKGYLYLELSGEDASILLDQGNKRITVDLPDGYRTHVSIRTPRTGPPHISFSKELAREHHLSAVPVRLSLAIDHSEHQFAMPEEVQELLDTDDDFRKKFLAIRPGTRRSLLFWCGYPKNALERAEKSIHLAQMVSLGQQSPNVIRNSFRRSEEWIREKRVKTVSRK